MRYWSSTRTAGGCSGRMLGNRTRAPRPRPRAASAPPPLLGPYAFSEPYCYNPAASNADYEAYGPTDVDAQAGDGRLTVNENAAGTLTVFKWPNPSYYNQLKYLAISRNARGQVQVQFPNEGSFAGLAYSTKRGRGFSWLRQWRVYADLRLARHAGAGDDLSLAGEARHHGGRRRPRRPRHAHVRAAVLGDALTQVPASGGRASSTTRTSTRRRRGSPISRSPTGARRSSPTRRPRTSRARTRSSTRGREPTRPQVRPTSADRGDRLRHARLPAPGRRRRLRPRQPVRAAGGPLPAGRRAPYKLGGSTSALGQTTGALALALKFNRRRQAAARVEITPARLRPRRSMR